MSLVQADTMRAAVIDQPRRTTLSQVSVPEPGASEVRVQLQGSGVCASNIPVWEGRSWFQYPQSPGSPGHEGWGVVDKVGEGVTSLKRGDRVAMLSYKAYAQYDIATENAVLPLPDRLTRSAFPGEPLGCAMNIFDRSDIRPGDDVAIVGIGFLGALLTRLVERAGARVLAISRRQFSLDVARQFGASETIPMDDHWKIIERVKSLTGGKGCERVIEAVGLQWPLDLAGELTAERGKLVIAGYHQDGVRQVNMQLWNWRGIDVINAHERDPQAYTDGMRKAIDAVTTGLLDPTPLFTHKYALDELDQAFESTSLRPDGFMKAVVEM